MCLIAFAIQASPSCPLRIAANRDEFLERPTAPLHRWSLGGMVEVVAGRDLRDGGTWLGASNAGRVAMLTNVRSARPGPGPRSRGELAMRWLQGGVEWEELESGIDAAAYGGFNLVVGDFHQGFWAWASNRPPEKPHEDHPADVRLHSRRLRPGIYGLSNATLDTPWSKTVRLKNALAVSLDDASAAPAGTDWRARLKEALADRSPEEDRQLPRSGVPIDLERILSSPFVSTPDHNYGTRSSLLLNVSPKEAGAGWRVDVDEWTHVPSGADGHAWRDDRRSSETLVWPSLTEAA